MILIRLAKEENKYIQTIEWYKSEQEFWNKYLKYLNENDYKYIRFTYINKKYEQLSLF